MTHLAPIPVVLSSDEALALAQQSHDHPPTRLPWKLEPVTGLDGELLHFRISSELDNCEDVAKLPAEDGADMDGEFIVRAANSHLDLVHTVTALHARIAELDAILAGRPGHPTVAEVFELTAQGGFFRWSADDGEHSGPVDSYAAVVDACRAAAEVGASLTWWAHSADGRPVAWPKGAAR